VEREWKSWIGRSEVSRDRVTPAPIAALSATLDRDDPPPRKGDPLPPLWHWLYFLPHYRQSEVGPDGHAKRGGFLPPVPLPRRMWGGGRLQFTRALQVGEAIKRESTIVDVVRKEGRSGSLVFVVVRHTIRGENGLHRRGARHRLSRRGARQLGSQSNFDRRPTRIRCAEAEIRV
jgi:3-methylfumaryl-CoA hydratase